jgi:transcriptional regulator with XRE-family HTH domain
MKLARLKEWRESHGLTQKELAAEARASEWTVVRAEAGAQVRTTTARRLAESLGVTVADLMEWPPVPLGEAPASQHPGPTQTSVDPDVKGPDEEEWGPDRERPKWEPPLSHGKDIKVHVGEKVITERSFLEVARELRRGEITPEEAYERAKQKSLAEEEESA